MQATKSKARLAGLLYLSVILFGMFAELFVRARLIDPNKAAQTVQNILTNEILFRFGFISDLIMQLSFFLLSLALYQLLKHIDRAQALFMLLSVSVSVAIMCLNMLHQYAAILIIDQASQLSTLSIEEINYWVAFFLDLQKYGYRIAQLFFGLWLFPLGCLVYRSNFIPRIIGILLLIACVSFLLDFFFFFLIPGYSAKRSSIVTLPTTIAEFTLCLWLLIIGVRLPNSKP